MIAPGGVLRSAARLANMALYGAALAVSRAAGLLTLPVYARVLGADDFGRYELLTSLLALLFSVSFMGMDFAMAVRYYEASHSARRADAASAFLVTATLSISAAIVIALGAPWLAGALLHEPSQTLPVVALAIALPFNVIASVQILILRLQFRAGGFFVTSVPSVAVGSATGVLLVLVGHLGLAGAMIGQSVTYALMVLIGALLIQPAFRVTDLSRSNTKGMVRLGLPWVPAGVAIWVFALSDRLFVSGLVGFAQLGLYAAAARISSVLALLQTGFQLAWGPLALQWGTAVDRETRYRRSLLAVAKFGGASVVVVSLLSGPLIELLAGHAYADGHKVVWLLGSSVLFNALFYIATIGLNLAQRSGRLATATALAAVANTVLNVVLIPVFGYVGAGIATLAAYFVALVTGYFLSQRVLPLSIGFAAGIAWAALAVAAAAASTYLTPPLGIGFAGAVAAWLTASGLREASKLWRAAPPEGKSDGMNS